MKNLDSAPATKGDIRVLAAGLTATREDIKRLEAATKEELKAFATKDEFREVKRDLALESARNAGRFIDFRDDINAAMAANTSKIIKTMDGFMAQFIKVDRAQVLTENRVNELDKRVKMLENPQ